MADTLLTCCLCFILGLAGGVFLSQMETRMEEQKPICCDYCGKSPATKIDIDDFSADFVYVCEECGKDHEFSWLWVGISALLIFGVLLIIGSV